MNIRNIFDQKKTVFSLEIFPPKRTDGIETLYQSLDRIAAVKPDYISVTYSAGGSATNELTGRIAADIKTRYGIEPLPHLTCLYNTKEQVKAQLEVFEQSGIENILALRGDRRPELEVCKDFAHASDLAAFIRENSSLNCVGACYPEGHPEAPGRAADVRNLKYKIDAGVTHLNSQLFLDNDDFYSFLELCEAAGINVPIEAGIMPLMTKSQIERMIIGFGASMPRKLSRIITKYENDPDGLFKAGMGYAIGQIIDLISQGVSGIHLYTMNRPEVTETIYDSIKSLL